MKIKTPKNKGIFLSKGNMKLPKTIAIWSLPAIKTCPGANGCQNVCYARKAEIQYNHVVPQCRENNLRLSKAGNFDKMMIEAITKSKRTIVRVHESGDFYNQTYLNSWIRIAKAMPNIRFYAYTKSLMLDFSKMPDNFRIIVDAEILQRGELPSDGFFHCQGDCKACNYCYDDGFKVVKVSFTVH